MGEPQDSRVFVTVGTTKFEQLINTVTTDEVLDILDKLGHTTLVLQYGNGNHKEKCHPKLKLEYHKYYSNFEEEIERSSLVISHAGAGSCLEVLKKHKPLIVVINENLMDNHQTELAEQLQKLGYLYYCTCDMLKDTLSAVSLYNLKPYPKGEPKAFAQYLDKCMGFSTT